MFINHVRVSFVSTGYYFTEPILQTYWDNLGIRDIL